MSASSALASPARRRSSSDRSPSSPCITRECTTRAENPGWLLAALLEELGDEAGPARLVARADADAVVAVEVLVEQNHVAPRSEERRVGKECRGRRATRRPKEQLVDYGARNV